MLEKMGRFRDGGWWGVGCRTRSVVRKGVGRREVECWKRWRGLRIGAGGG